MSIKYIGRTTNFEGKTLWEILGNLKNFGVGRVVIRNGHQRYEEKCFYRIMKVEALHNEDPRKIRATVEKVFRGRKYKNLVDICSTSYKADYKLIPKSEEENFCKIDKVSEEKILPRYIDCPPLLREFIMQENLAKGKEMEEPMLPIRLGKSKSKLARVAKKNETPNIKIGMGLGTPISPCLYENISVQEERKL